MYRQEGAADPRGTTVPPSIQRGFTARSQPVKQLLIVSFPALVFTNLLFCTFNELHPNYFRYHALGINIKVDDMKSNTQPSFVSVIPQLTESFTSVLTVRSRLLLRITLHSILCFVGFLQLVSDFYASRVTPGRIMSYCIWPLALWNPSKYGGKRVGGGGGEGRVNSLSCSRLSASWNCTYRTFKLIRIHTTNSLLFSSAIAKPAKYANAREKRHPRKVTRLLYTKTRDCF